jgi:SAM-dependent methyltransferase
MKFLFVCEMVSWCIILQLLLLMINMAHAHAPGRTHKVFTPGGWDEHALDYAETIHDHFTSKFALDAIRQVVGNQDPLKGIKEMEAKLGRGLRVIDVACGPGGLTLQLAKLLRDSGNGGYVLGVDFSPKMVQLLDQSAKKFNLDNVEAKVMNGEVNLSRYLVEC